MDNTQQVTVTHHTRTAPVPEKSVRALLLERPLVIRLNGSAEYSIMRTPGHDRELAIGFLFTEGLIRGIADVGRLNECPDSADVMEVTTLTAGGGPAKRTTTVNSSCGLCGRTDIDALLAAVAPVTASTTMPVSVLYEIPDRIRKTQLLFHATGASHAAGLFGARGEILVAREDVGRHNALDKVIGNRLLAGQSAEGCGAFLSGRASLEMIVKAARARLPIVAAVSAPTAAAVEAAERLCITLCGFVRGAEVTVYTHEGRIRPARGAAGKGTEEGPGPMNPMRTAADAGTAGGSGDVVRTVPDPDREKNGGIPCARCASS